ncbi:hypothetical protein KI387_009309, partial [Taxus chinensis]
MTNSSPPSAGVNAVSSENVYEIVERPVVSSDAPKITTFKRFRKESWVESKKLWTIATPVIFSTVCQYTVSLITQSFVGHLGTAELASFSIVNSVIAGLTFGIMLGMSSALETLCGQAFGAGQTHMLGVYLQRSLLISNVTALFMTLIYIFSTPILKLIGQQVNIAELSGKFAIWILPTLFAFGCNFPMQKFLQAQSKVMVMAWVSLVGVLLNTFLSWLCVIKLGWGLAGAAVSLNVSWWVMVSIQFFYVVYYCQECWKGFSWSAYHDMMPFIRLSMASGVMLCLEIWYPMVLILLTGHLKNAEIALNAMSICVRVSNELGAGNPKAAKFSTMIVVMTGLLLGITFMGIILVVRNKFAIIFTSSNKVLREVSRLLDMLAVTMVLNSVQPILSGVAVGVGSQVTVAYVNLGCYYAIGLPLGFVLGYKYHFGIKGVWFGILGGTALQTVFLFLLTIFTNWNRKAAQAENRIELWGGSNRVLND